VLGAFAGSVRAEPSHADHRLQLPLVLHAYTRQVQLGTLQAVVHPALALGVEYPYWRAGDFSFFPSWRLGFEHHAHMHQRWYLGVGPSARYEPHARVAFQLSLAVCGALLSSLWTPYQFDSGAGTWARGESQSKWVWMFDSDLTVWLNVNRRFGIGLDYGFGILYPLAPVNDLPVLPLTRLGILARWVYGA